MQLLRDRDEFEQWKREHIFEGDTAEDPKEFPCLAATDVVNWRYEEVRAVYVYRDSIDEMLAELKWK
jgi:hypothetical protein